MRLKHIIPWEGTELVRRHSYQTYLVIKERHYSPLEEIVYNLQYCISLKGQSTALHKYNCYWRCNFIYTFFYFISRRVVYIFFKINILQTIIFFYVWLLSTKVIKEYVWHSRSSCTVVVVVVVYSHYCSSRFNSSSAVYLSSKTRIWDFVHISNWQNKSRWQMKSLHESILRTSFIC